MMNNKFADAVYTAEQLRERLGVDEESFWLAIAVNRIPLPRYILNDEMYFLRFVVEEWIKDGCPDMLLSCKAYSRCNQLLAESLGINFDAAQQYQDILAKAGKDT